MVRRRLRLAPAPCSPGRRSRRSSAAVVWPRARGATSLVCVLQMNVYVAAYKMPDDDERRARSRRACGSTTRSRSTGCSGAGELPTARLQRALHTDGSFSRLETVLVWAHWVWFATPHASLAVRSLARPRRLRARRGPDLRRLRHRRDRLLARCRRRRPGTRRRRGGWCLRRGRAARVRRLMVEYGERFWRDRWGQLYSVFGGNPLAAMPSLHFATSTMARCCSARRACAGRRRRHLRRCPRLRARLPRRALRRRSAGGLALCAAVRAAEPLARAAARALRRARRWRPPPGPEPGAS